MEKHKYHEATVSYQIVNQTGIIVATRASLDKACETAKRLSNTCSQLFFIRSVRIEINDEYTYQLGKLKY